MIDDIYDKIIDMKRGPTLFLQVAIVFIGIGTLAFLLWEPHLEGRNVGATTFEIYFNDPFLAYAYLASIPFFVALYQAYRMLGYVRQNTAFSPAAVKSLRTIRYCAIAVIGFVVVGEIILFSHLTGESDDGPPAVMMGLLITFGSVVVAATSAMFEGIVQHIVKR